MKNENFIEVIPIGFGITLPKKNKNYSDEKNN